jgi:hypothetical protein
MRVVKFELIRLYEIQHSLRQLPYFDVFGRLRLSLQLARVTLSIPMAVDEAMKRDHAAAAEATATATTSEDDQSCKETGDVKTEKDDNGTRPRGGSPPSACGSGGLLGARLAGALSLAVGVLERGERIC